MIVRMNAARRTKRRAGANKAASIGTSDSWYSSGCQRTFLLKGSDDERHKFITMLFSALSG